MPITKCSLRSVLFPVIAAVATGCAAGLTGTCLWLILEWCTDTFSDSPWLVWLLPAGGTAIVLLYGRLKHVGGTNDVINAVQNNGSLSGLMAPLVFAGTFITRIFGGSVGSEGAAIQIGGSVASAINRILRISEQQTRIVLMSGISAGFAAVVGTPVTAVVLALELTGVGVMYYESILPCAVASCVSYTIASTLGVSFPHYPISAVPGLAPLPVLQVIALAALGGLVSIAICQSFEKTAVLSTKYVKSPYLRVIAGGIIIAAVSSALRTSAFNGGGLNLVQKAVQGHADPMDFVLKIAFTACCLGTGYKGGAIVPTLASGAAFGGFMGPLMGLAPSLSTGIGMTSVFCGAINCPMTAFILGIEVFGLNASLYFILACAVGYTCSGYYSLYPAQIIYRSKLHSETINRRAL